MVKRYAKSNLYKNIYFEGRASLGHFYVPIIRPNTAQTRDEHGKLMQVPRTRTVTGGKVMSVRVPKFWNSIKSEFRLIESLDVFKRMIPASAFAVFENHPT